MMLQHSLVKYILHLISLIQFFAGHLCKGTVHSQRPMRGYRLQRPKQGYRWKKPMLGYRNRQGFYAVDTISNFDGK